MAKELPPWADMLPQSVYKTREDPLSYRWDHIDTEITEGEECISWCRTGLFDPTVNRVNFGVRSAGNAERELSTIQPVIFDSISHIRTYPPCELPINADHLSTSFSMRGLTSDGFNLYVADTITQKVHKLLGESGEIDSSIDFPAAYASSPPWYFRSLSWYNGNLCLHFNNQTSEEILWVEMDGFSDTIDKVISCYNLSYTELIGELTLTCLQVDPINGWIVGLGNGYRPTGGYRQRLVRWDYATGNRIGDLTSTLSPYGNQQYSYFAINYDDNLIYAYKTDTDAIYTFDYTEVTTYFPLEAKYSIPFGGSYRGGDHGMWWHPDKPEDMWMSGFYNIPAGAERIWKYIFDSDIEQFCGQGDFTYFSSTAAITTDITSDADQAEIDNLPGWDNRFFIYIDSDKIDADLTDYPVPINLSAGSSIDAAKVAAVFSELGSNSLKLAVTTADGLTECEVEVERWDSGIPSAQLWAKIPLVSSTTDTLIIFYYDNDHADNTAYVGVTGSVAAAAVWDDDFMLVMHLSDDLTGSVLNSTSYSNNGTAYNTPTSVDGMVAKAIGFDGTGEYIRGQDSTSLRITGDITVESSFKSDSVNAQWIAEKTYQNNDSGYALGLSAGGQLVFRTWSGAGSNFDVKTDQTFIGGQWHYAAGRRASDIISIWANKGETGLNNSLDTDSIGSIAANGETFNIGARWDGVQVNAPMKGAIDEVRVSRIARSDAWIKATGYAMRDQLNDGTDDYTFYSGELDDYAYRVPLAIPAANISADIDLLPVMVNISAASGVSNRDLTAIFDELGANNKKISLTDGDGVTQRFVEIQQWDETGEEAILWVSPSSLSSTVDNTLYLYFDNSRVDNTGYIFETTEDGAKYAWDDNFLFVGHCGQAVGSTVIDSSRFDHNCFHSGMAADDLIDAVIGKGYSMDGVNDHLRASADYSNLRPTGDITLESYFRSPSAGISSGYIMGRFYLGQNKYWGLLANTNGTVTALLDDGVHQDAYTVGTYLDDTWHYLVGRRDDTSLETIVDANYSGDDYTFDDNGRNLAISTSGVRFAIGGRWDNVSLKSPYKGDVDEVRVSNVARPNSYISATKLSGEDNLITYSAIEAI